MVHGEFTQPLNPDGSLMEGGLFEIDAPQTIQLPQSPAPLSAMTYTVKAVTEIRVYGFIRNGDGTSTVTLDGLAQINLSGGGVNANDSHQVKFDATNDAASDLIRIDSQQFVTVFSEQTITDPAILSQWQGQGAVTITETDNLYGNIAFYTDLLGVVNYDLHFEVSSRELSVNVEYFEAQQTAAPVVTASVHPTPSLNPHDKIVGKNHKELADLFA